MIRVTIVSPNHALRVGLREMLGSHANIKVVGEAVNLESVNENEAEVVAIKDAHKADWPDGHPLSAAFKDAFTAAYKRTKTSSPIPAA